MRKTKIVCTLGPASTDPKVMREMMLAGMNLARFNFSHGTHEEHLEKLNTLRALRDELKLPVATLLDTKGPEIRLRDFEGGKAMLEAGQTFILTNREVMGDQNQVSVTYHELPLDVAPGSRILLDDGLIELKVQEIRDGTDILCTVVNGGKISNHKGVNLPGTKISMPYLSETDIRDIEFGIQENFDFIAASFVRSAQDILDVRNILIRNGCRTMKIIAKIENAEGVSNLDQILRAADGIMVARGDLGVEINMEEIPHLQKVMIRKCYQSGKMVITATQMLESMIQNPRPTRAEVNDVANAIYDGTSAIMLSGETAAGKYPVEAVRTMASIAERTESDIDYRQQFRDRGDEGSASITDAISHATCTTAHDLGASAIISVSKSGRTARMVSKYRPGIQIIACTSDVTTYHQLSLSWGVTPVLVGEQKDTDSLFECAVTAALEGGYVKDGDLVVITAGVPVGMSGTTNLLKVQTAGTSLISGTGLNALSAVGNICVARSNEELLANFNFGDILVCNDTCDAWMKMMRHAAGVITAAGANSHIASVVDQLNIPIICGAADCCAVLKTGMTVVIDARRGVVTPMQKQ